MFTAVESLIGTLMYPMFSVIFTFIMAIESMFYGFAGIGDVAIGNTMITSANEGNLTDTGIIYYLLTSEFVRNLFLSLLLLAIVLLVLFAAIACVRNMYAEKPKTWQEIFNSTIKGLMGFIITPVLCLVGAWAGNILLKAINTATNPSGTSSLAGELFVVSAYNANIYRMGTDTGPGTAAHVATLTQQGDAYQTLINSNPTIEDYADFVDQCYASKPWTITGQAWVAVGYNVFNINYLLLAVGGVFMLYALGAITFGAVKRMFLLVFYFVLSPLAHAMAPIDDGEAGKKVRGEFYKNFLSVYGAVVGLNLFFSIMPVFQHIDIPVNWAALGGGNATATWASPFHGIFNLIIVIVGLLTVKELISFVSGLAGGGDLYNTGTTTMNSVKGKMKHVKTMGKIGGSFVGGMVKVNSARRNAEKSYLEGLADEKGNNLGISTKKDLKDALRSGTITQQQYDQYISKAGAAGDSAWFQAAGDVAKNQAKQVAQWVNKGSGLDIDTKAVTKFFKGQAKEGRELASEKSKTADYKDKMERLKKKENPFAAEVSREEVVTEPGGVYGDDEYGDGTSTSRTSVTKVRDNEASMAATIANLFDMLKNAKKQNKDENDLKEARKLIFGSDAVFSILGSIGINKAEAKKMEVDDREAALAYAQELLNNKTRINEENRRHGGVEADTAENFHKMINDHDFKNNMGFKDFAQTMDREVQSMKVNSLTTNKESKGDADNNIKINADEIAEKLGGKITEKEGELLEGIGNKISEMGSKLDTSIKDLTNEIKNNTPKKIAGENAKNVEKQNAKNKKKKDE